MSRIGKKPVPVPKGVDVRVDGQAVKVKGPKGELEFVVNERCLVALEDNAVVIRPAEESRHARAIWGLSRTMVSNMFTGVSTGFTRKLELVGVGYKAQMKGKTLVLALGYSHDVEFETPEGLTITTPKPTEIEISGRDKQAVGEAAAKIRSHRPPEPYKAKGVRYAGEFIFRKEGKKK